MFLVIEKTVILGFRLRQNILKHRLRLQSKSINISKRGYIIQTIFNNLF